MAKSKHYNTDCTCPPVWDCARHKPRGLDRSTASKVKKNPALKRTQALKGKSVKQEVRQAFIAGVKAERLWGQFERRGMAYCENCDKTTFDPRDVQTEDTWPGDELFVEQAAAHIDAHHIKKRSAGHPYKSPSDHGVDSPTNLVLLCRVCHSKEESNPSWGAGHESEAS